MFLIEEDIACALAALKKGGIILYPTDTVWGIGCDATNELAVSKIYALKKKSRCESNDCVGARGAMDFRLCRIT